MGVFLEAEETSLRIIEVEKCDLEAKEPSLNVIYGWRGAF